mmetsp:Transcript_21914/g.58654  ORF Transcript_21914/g.58654 Transcript_21914/m.58654 type:complete len:224 (+) Transcript_21914:377-1048(+)
MLTLERPSCDRSRSFVGPRSPVSRITPAVSNAQSFRVSTLRLSAYTGCNFVVAAASGHNLPSVTNGQAGHADRRGILTHKPDWPSTLCPTNSPRCSSTGGAPTCPRSKRGPSSAAATPPTPPRPVPRPRRPASERACSSCFSLRPCPRRYLGSGVGLGGRINGWLSGWPPWLPGSPRPSPSLPARWASRSPRPGPPWGSSRVRSTRISSLVRLHLRSAPSRPP